MALVPNTLVTGNPALAADLNENFQALEDHLTRITDEDIASDAGINRSKLLHPFSASEMEITIVGDPGSAASPSLLNSVAANPPDVSTATSLVKRVYLRADPSTRKYLVAIDAYAAIYTAGITPAADIRLWVYLNSVLLSGGPLTINSVGPHRLANASPFQSPFSPIQDGDYLEFYLGRTATGSATAPTIRNLTATITFKSEHVL